MTISKYALAAMLVSIPTINTTSHATESIHRFLQGNYDAAEESYKELNKNPEQPFVVGIGIADSQNAHRNNTVHPEILATLLQQACQQSSNPAKWLKQHWGYVAQCLPQATCLSCRATVQYNTLTIKQHEDIIDAITTTIAAHKNAKSIAMTTCHVCGTKNMIQQPSKITPFTDMQAEQMKQQIIALGSFNQAGAKTLPTYRLSLELTDILQDGTDQIDAIKLAKTAQRLEALHYPLTFMHHYTNPSIKQHLFEQKEDIAWFANCCAQIVQACPGLTHVCPISQVMGLYMRMTYETLPPFNIQISTQKYFNNLVQAQVQAGRAMKKVNPDIQVLLSHQWKPARPTHHPLDPRYAIEKAICYYFDSIYNQVFVKAFKKYNKDIDGIALSIYPALAFDVYKPLTDNCAGILDHEAALEAIEKTAAAFPGKDIYIVETGCNNADQKIKKKFVDMTLQACKIARQKGIPVKTCFFWGHTNQQYMEWNTAPGATNFGAFETFDPNSINEYGKYLRDVTSCHP